MIEWLNDLIIEWINEQRNEQANKQTNEWINESMNQWTNKEMFKWMNEWMNEKVYSQRNYNEYIHWTVKFQVEYTDVPNIHYFMSILLKTKTSPLYHQHILHIIISI